MWLINAFKQKCGLLSYHCGLMSLWAFVLWAFVLWAYVLWAFVLHSLWRRSRRLCSWLKRGKRAITIIINHSNKFSFSSVAKSFSIFRLFVLSGHVFSWPVTNCAAMHGDQWSETSDVARRPIIALVRHHLILWRHRFLRPRTLISRYEKYMSLQVTWPTFAGRCLSFDLSCLLRAFIGRSPCYEAWRQLTAGLTSKSRAAGKT